MIRLSIFFAAAVIALSSVNAAAQSKTVWDGVYTQQQAARGAASFMSNCSRCHSAEADAESRPLAGKAFWDSFRESTVDRLLDYVSRNMPNGAGAGTLEASTYADLVAFILSRNDLPSGATELTKESATGVQIIAKTGPGELPTGTLVNVVGCLAPKEGGKWTLKSATTPERPNPQPGTDDAARPLGTRNFELKFVITSLDSFVGHRLRVRGLLMGEGGRDGINVTTTDSVAKTCP